MPKEKVTKEQRKRDTRWKARTAMKLANQIGMYNTSGRDMGGVLDQQGRVPAEELTAFSRSAVATHGTGMQSPAFIIEDQRFSRDGEDDEFEAARGFSARQMREEGGKAGFKLKGTTAYGKVLNAFRQYETLGEETKEQAAAKLGAAMELQTLAGDWARNHNLAAGGSGKSDEARKGAAVLRLYTHMQVEQSRLQNIYKKAPTEQELEFQRKLINIEETSRDLMLSNANAEREVNFGTVRGTNSASAALSSGGMGISMEHVVTNCVPHITNHLGQWMRMQNDPENIQLIDHNEMLNKSFYMMKPELIIACIDDVLDALTANVPQKLLMMMVAHMRGMQGYTLKDGTATLNMDDYAGSTLMLRLLSPQLVVQSMKALKDVDPVSADESNSTLYASVVAITAVIQSVANNRVPSVTSRIPIYNHTMQRMGRWMKQIGQQITAQV